MICGDIDQADELLDESIDWTQKEVGGYRKLEDWIPLDRDLMSRMSHILNRNVTYDGEVTLRTRAPFRGPRVFGMNAALASLRETVLGFTDVHSYDHHVNEFWRGGRSDPALAPFFQQAEEEMARLDGNPLILAVSLSIRLSMYIGWNDKIGLGDRRLFESLR